MGVVFLIVAILFVLVVVWKGESTRRSNRACLGSLCLVAGVAGLVSVAGPGVSSVASRLGAQEEASNGGRDVPENSTDAKAIESRPSESETGAKVDQLTPGSVPLTAEDTSSLAPEPATKVLIPPGRPAWVESALVRQGNVHQTPVSSGPHARRRECDRALDEEITAAVNDYINWYLESNAASSLVTFSLDDLKNRFIPRENYYFETIEVSIGKMHQGHALLRFDDAFRKELDSRWDQIKATSRLLQVGLVGAGVIALLGTMFGYFRLDTATRGHYAGRLQFASVAAILALIGAGVFAGSRFGDLLLMFL